MLNKLWNLRGKPSIDEHDEQTEPLPPLEDDAFAPTIPNPLVPQDEQDVPSPQNNTQPFPHRFIEELPVQSHPAQTPVGSNIYPVLPAKPHTPLTPAPAGQPNSTASHQISARRNMFPVAVGMCFVAIEMLLLVRFTFKLLNVPSDSVWIEAVYGVSNVFVLPFRALFLQLAIPQFFTLELYTLLAVVVYSFVSRLLVRTLKVLLKTH